MEPEWKPETAYERLQLALASARDRHTVMLALREFLRSELPHTPWSWWLHEGGTWQRRLGSVTPPATDALMEGGQSAGGAFALTDNARLHLESPTQELARHRMIWALVAACYRRAEDFEEARRLTTVDEVTGLFNARHLGRVLEHELARSRRFGRQLSLLFIDLDHFKAVNDDLGHGEGTRLLSEIGKLLGRCVRRSDHAFRYGGDEFAVCLVETDRPEAVAVAERFRREIRKYVSSYADIRSKISASIGVASFPSDGDSVEGLLERADAAMYRAKAGGRNAVYTLDLRPRKGPDL